MDRPSLMGGVARPVTLEISGNRGSREEEEQRMLSQLATGVLKFPESPTRYSFGAANLIDRGSIGSGNFGTVHKMEHNVTGRMMAVKRIRFHNINGREQERLLREHNTMVQTEQCENIVKFYGVIFHEGDCWICMELLDVSLDRLYRRVYNHLHQRLTEPLIGHIAVCTITALDYLKTSLKIMHRDVKPSNILVDRQGNVKLCDFGICGELEDSIAQSHDVGCQPYLAPERVTKMQSAYDVRSDVWSLGLTLFEIAKGEFPYKNWSSPFEQINAVVKEDPPMLTQDDENQFSLDFVLFVNSCLTKDYHSRPKYNKLKEFAFFKTYSTDGILIPEAKEQLGIYALDALNNPEPQRA